MQIQPQSVLFWPPSTTGQENFNYTEIVRLIEIEVQKNHNSSNQFEVKYYLNGTVVGIHVVNTKELEWTFFFANCNHGMEQAKKLRLLTKLNFLIESIQSTKTFI